MYVCAYHRAMKFEWDESKYKTNLEKHGVSFVDAVNMLLSGNFYKESSNYEQEQRTRATGLIDLRYITVVYTVRADKIRIISARVANQKERKNFDEQKRKNNDLH